MPLLEVMQNIGNESSVKAFLIRGLCTFILWRMAGVVKSVLAVSRRYRSEI